jgi:hypothetical protein
MKQLLGHVLVFLVRAYQLAISPMLGSNCRFAPSCSSYAIEAIQAHGPFAGALMAIKRIGRCHPFHPGGFDPVPPSDAVSRGASHGS